MSFSNYTTTTTTIVWLSGLCLRQPGWATTRRYISPSSGFSGAKTVVRTVYGNNNGFEVKVGMHQGSALGPLLFVNCDGHGSFI